MCVRTKTSYGCGHAYKSTTDCYSSACAGIERYHYLKEGDCRECKSEGTNVSRGREGKGRYAQKLKKEQSKDKSTSAKDSTSAGDDESVRSPWAPHVKEEQTWNGPHRKQVDDAWVSEHEDRMSDLQELMGKVRVSGGHSRSESFKEIVALRDDYDRDDYEQDEYDSMPETALRKRLQVDVRRHLDGKAEQASSHRGEDRQYSHDSLPDSMPSYRSSPKMRKAATFNVVYPHPEIAYEYDYYSSPPGRLPPKRHRAQSNNHHHQHYHQRYHHQPDKSKIDPYHSRSRSYGYSSDYEILDVPPPPLQIPPPAPVVYDAYEYYSPSASPHAPFPLSDYRPYDLSRPPPSQLQHYVNYRGYQI